MADDTNLRLIAELKDDVTGRLAVIQKALRATGDAGKTVHASGAAQAREHAKAYRELGDSIGKIKNVAVDVVQPRLSALGVTAFSVAGAIAAVTSAVKAFGDAGQTLTFINRQSGATIAMIRGLAEAGQDFGISIETTEAGLAKFGAFMVQNARRAPDALNAWNQMPGAWQRIGRSLVGLNRDAQVNKVLDFLPSVKYADQRRKLLSILGLPEDWANLTREEITKMRAASDEFNRLHPFNAENARKSKEAWDAVARSLRGIRDDMGAAFGPAVVGAAESIHKFLDDHANLDAFAKSMRETGETIADVIRGYERLSVFLNHDIFGKKSLKNELAPYAHPDTFKDRFDALTEGKLKDAVTQGFLDALRQANGTYVPTAYHPGGGSPGGGGFFGSPEYPAIGGSAGPNPLTGGGGRTGGPGGGSPIPGNAGAGTRPFAGGAAGGGETPAGSGPAAAVSTRPSSRSRPSRQANGARQECRILARLASESRFNPTLRHPDQPRFSGEAHFAHGLYQEGGTEWNHYKAWLDKNHPGADWRDPRLQSRFAAENLKANYPKVWERMKNAKTREEAAAIYTSGYLKPAKQYELSRIAGFRHHGVPPLEAFTGPQQEFIEKHRANLRDHIRGGRASQTDGELLKRGMKAVDAGSLKGSASLTVDFRNMPKGVRTASTHEGLFKQVTLNRGRPMAPASETS